MNLDLDLDFFAKQDEDGHKIKIQCVILPILCTYFLLHNCDCGTLNEVIVDIDFYIVGTNINICNNINSIRINVNSHTKTFLPPFYLR